MRYDLTCAVGALAMVLTSACSSNDEYIAKLRDAMAQSAVTLSDTIVVAEAESQTGTAVKAALLVDADPVFSVRALQTESLTKYHIDLTGAVLFSADAGVGSGLCPGAISLVQAIAVAEGEAGGVAVAIVPDDDVACAQEVQVLTPDTLWEVKVGAQGQVLESEESDEDGTDDD